MKIMLKHYILENKQLKEVPMLEWAKWIENFKNRIIKKDLVEGVDVSTVFLGIDHGFSEEGEPIVFETMIFGGKHDGCCERYSTYEEALKGHKKAKRLVKKIS